MSKFSWKPLSLIFSLKFSNYTTVNLPNLSFILSSSLSITEFSSLDTSYWLVRDEGRPLPVSP
jgi:hypothetical protein